MATRYDGTDSNLTFTPDLEIVNRLTQVGESLFGKVCILLKWNKLESVSEEEKRRSNVVYSWQKNRTPFIDNADWISKIWDQTANCN